MNKEVDVILIGLIALLGAAVVGFFSIIVYAADTSPAKKHKASTHVSVGGATITTKPNQAPIKDSTLENDIEDGKYDTHLEKHLDENGEFLNVSVEHTRKVIQKDGQKMNKWTYRMSATIDVAPPFYRPHVTNVHVKTVYTPYEKQTVKVRDSQ